MRRAPDLLSALTFAAALVGVAAAEPANDSPSKGKLLDGGQFGNRKDPIVVTSDTLEYDYKSNIVVYRGTVQAMQGEVKLRSDTLTVTLRSDNKPGDAAAKDPIDSAAPDRRRLQEIVAAGNVRIDNGTRWATGGKAVFDQSQRTLTLTEGPMLHDGTNEVAGDRVIVYLDEDRSVVEGGRRRVKAVLHPGKDGGLAPSGAKKSDTAAPTNEPAAHDAEPAAPAGPTARVATP